MRRRMLAPVLGGERLEGIQVGDGRGGKWSRLAALEGEVTGVGDHGAVVTAELG